MSGDKLPVFPQEIFDCIIHHSRRNRRALATISLVCSHWVPASRRHLFREITLKPSNLKGFEELCASKSATFLHHVRYLSLRPDDPSDTTTLVDKELVSWFPNLPSTKCIALDDTKWDSIDTLTRFASLLPSVTIAGLSGRGVDNIQDINHFFRVFPLLEQFVWAGDITLTMSARRKVLHELPQPGPDTFLPLHLKSIAFLDHIRDDIICHIPFGPIQLTQFDAEITTAEHPMSLQNLMFFIIGHCLNVSALKLTITVAESSPYPKFSTIFANFLTLFEHFTSLKSFQLTILWEVYEKQLPEWVYEILERLNADLKISNLGFGFWIPEEPETELNTSGTRAPQRGGLGGFLDRGRLESIIRHKKFDDLEQLDISWCRRTKDGSQVKSGEMALVRSVLVGQ